MTTATKERSLTRRVQARDDAQVERFRTFLANGIKQSLREKQLTQTEAARIMRDAPSQISLVVTGKLQGFSTERLMRMYQRIGNDVTIVASRTPKGGPGALRIRNADAALARWSRTRPATSR